MDRCQIDATSCGRAWRGGRGRRLPSPAPAGHATGCTTRVVPAAAHLDHDPAHRGRRHRDITINGPNSLRNVTVTIRGFNGQAGCFRFTARP
jgi:hypothetical protein